MRQHVARSPDLPALLDVLRHREIEYVLIGSVAAAVYGVQLVAGDLDIVPSTEADNLERLVQALADIGATPLGPFGDWTKLESGELKWVARATSDAELAAWRPDATDVRTLDHLFVTCHGNLDIVPSIAGSFETLRPRAVVRTWLGRECRVAHIDELLARTTVPRREKDRDRVVALRNLQRHLVTPGS